MSKPSKMVTATILSMSLLTVMAAAAIAPAIGIIKEHFASSPDILVQMIISIPALFIIITNMFFLQISKVWRTRTIATIGLLLYVVAGTGCFFIDNLNVLLVMRALLGVSVGLIMPLSTGLLSYFYTPEEQARLMGLSAAMNQMGGVVGTLLAGVLASIEWNYAFLVYVFGLVAHFMILRFLPNEKLGSSNKRGKEFVPRQLLKFHPSVIGMLLLTIIKNNKSMNTGNRVLAKNNSCMVVISRGKQWTSFMGYTSVELREELAWEFGGRTTNPIANLDTQFEIHSLFS